MWVFPHACSVVGFATAGFCQPKQRNNQLVFWFIVTARGWYQGMLG